jgi:hypothetical protein
LRLADDRWRLSPCRGGREDEVRERENRTDHRGSVDVWCGFRLYNKARSAALLLHGKNRGLRAFAGKSLVWFLSRSLPK